MTYLVEDDISKSPSMNNRVAQCSASEGQSDADAWTYAQRRVWAASPGWADAWASALASHPDEPDYDPGADEAVITDGMILAEVQGLLAAAAP